MKSYWVFGIIADERPPHIRMNYSRKDWHNILYKVIVGISLAVAVYKKERLLSRK